MADVKVDLESSNATELLGQGIKAYMMREYNTAVSALSRALEFVVKEHNDDKHDSLAEIYLFYGKALLELSREEAEPLGDAIPRGEDESEDEEDQIEDEKENEEETTTKTNEDGNENEKKSEESASSKSPSKIEKENVSDSKVEKESQSAEVKVDCSNSEVVINCQNTEDKSDKNTEDKSEKNTEEKSDKNTEEKSDKSTEEMEHESEPGTSNGCEEKKEEVEEEPTDLQVAWEVLELAKIIYEKRGDSSKKDLAEALITLGEVSMESENFESAVVDIQQGLNIQKSVLENDSRKLAETYYKLGIALSANNKIDEAIENFNESLKILNNRIEKLKKDDDNLDFKSEIEEINSLIPEIEEKISDFKSFKEEAMKKLNEELLKKMGPKSEEKPSIANSTGAKANDISHLVKRKRKIEDIAEDLDMTPAKKKSEEKPASEEKKSPSVIKNNEEIKNGN